MESLGQHTYVITVDRIFGFFELDVNFWGGLH